MFDEWAPVDMVEADALDPLSIRRRVDEMAVALVDGHVTDLVAGWPEEEQIAGLQLIQRHWSRPSFEVAGGARESIETRASIAVDDEAAAVESFLGTTAAIAVPSAQHTACRIDDGRARVARARIGAGTRQGRRLWRRGGRAADQKGDRQDEHQPRSGTLRSRMERIELVCAHRPLIVRPSAADESEF